MSESKKPYAGLNVDKAGNVIINSGGVAHKTGWILSIKSTSPTGVATELSLMEGYGFHDGGCFRVKTPPNAREMTLQGPLLEFTAAQFKDLTGWAEPSVNGLAGASSRFMVLTIDSTGNAAFEDTGREKEVARIINEVAQRLDSGDVPLAMFAEKLALRDLNGNTVGSVVLTDEKPIPGSPAGGFRAFVELGTDTASTPESVLAQALRETAHRIAEGQAQFAIHDWKGNRVGEALLSASPEAAKESNKDSDAEPSPAGGMVL